MKTTTFFSAGGPMAAAEIASAESTKCATPAMAQM